MAINREFLNAFSSSIDQPESVNLSAVEPEFRSSSIAKAVSCITRCFSGAIEVVSSVDQVVI